MESLVVSAPNPKCVITPVLRRVFTPPFAKYSAEEQAQTLGISITKSAPALKAISALQCLLNIEGIPRCKKLPLIAIIQ